MCTVSPVCTPARLRAVKTPICLSRAWANSSASSLVRSLRATARTAARPTTFHEPSSKRSIEISLAERAVQRGRPPRRCRRLPGVADQNGELAEHGLQTRTGHRRHDRPVEVVIGGEVGASNPRRAGAGRAGRADSSRAPAGAPRAVHRGDPVPGREVEQHEQHPGPFDVA